MKKAVNNEDFKTYGARDYDKLLKYRVSVVYELVGLVMAVVMSAVSSPLFICGEGN